MSVSSPLQSTQVHYLSCASFLECAHITQGDTAKVSHSLPGKTFGELLSRTRFRLCQMLRSLPRPRPRSCVLRIIRLHPPVGPRANALTRTLAYQYLLKAEVGTSIGKRIRAFLGLALRFTAAAISQPDRGTSQTHLAAAGGRSPPRLVKCGKSRRSRLNPEPHPHSHYPARSSWLR